MIRRAAPLSHQRVDLGRPELDQGELGGDEEAVQRDQEKAEREARPGAEGGLADLGQEQDRQHGC